MLVWHFGRWSLTNRLPPEDRTHGNNEDTEEEPCAHLGLCCSHLCGHGVGGFFKISQKQLKVKYPCLKTFFPLKRPGEAIVFKLVDKLGIWGSAGRALWRAGVVGTIPRCGVFENWRDGTTVRTKDRVAEVPSQADEWKNGLASNVTNGLA